MQCKQCEFEIPSGASFCPKCGAPIPEIEPDERDVAAEEASQADPANDPGADPPQTTRQGAAERESGVQPPQPASPRDRFRDAAAARQSDEEEGPETTVWEGSYSGKAMYGHFLLGLTISVVLAILLYWWKLSFSKALLWWLVGTMVIEVVLYIWLWVRKLSVRYELTTQRLIHQRGLLTRTTDRIELIDIDDVTYRQGPIQRMLGVGTIRVTSSDRTHPELEMPGIDPVREVAGKIDDLRRAERRRRGLHIESI